MSQTYASLQDAQVCLVREQSVSIGELGASVTLSYDASHPPGVPRVPSTKLRMLRAGKKGGFSCKPYRLAAGEKSHHQCLETFCGALTPTPQVGSGQQWP